MGSRGVRLYMERYKKGCGVKGVGMYRDAEATSQSAVKHMEGRAGQGRAVQGRAGQGGAGWGRVGLGRAGRGRAGQGQAM